MGERDARERATPQESIEAGVSTTVAETVAPEVIDRSASLAIDFSAWFVDQAVERGAMADVLDRRARAMRDVELAGRLIRTYGLAECEVRALRLFAAHTHHGPDRIHMPPTLSVLEYAWDWRQLSGQPLREFGATGSRSQVALGVPRSNRPQSSWSPPPREKRWFESRDGVRYLIRIDAANVRHEEQVPA